MVRFGRIAFLALLSSATAIVTAQAQDAATARGGFIANSGDEIGTVSFTGGPNGLVARVELPAGALEPGLHGFHMHQVADCSDRAKFETAKAHVKQDGQSHGYLSGEGPEAGDLPNLMAAPDGSAKAEFATGLASLSGERNILDEDGFAVVIHAKGDDYKDKDSAGARVACAEIKKQ